MPTVTIREGENFERALKKFTRACQKAGIFSDYRKNQYFEKPSERRKRKIGAAIRKHRRLIRIANQ